MGIIEGAIPRGAGVERGPGSDFFVDKDNGSNLNSGFSWQQAKATIQAGVDLTVTNKGDRVWVKVAATAYVENVVVALKDYVSILGVLNKSNWGRPDIHPTSGIGLVINKSQGFYGENLFMFSDDGDACTVDSEGWKFMNSRWQANANGILLKGDSVDDSFTASQGEAIGCTFWANGAAGIRLEHANNPSGVGVTDVKFKDCIFKENVGADFLSAVGVSGGGAGIFINLVIERCKFLDVGAAHVYMDMDQGVAADLAANSALIVDNFFADEAVIAAQIAIGGQPNVMFVGNKDAAGLIDGATFND